MRTTGARVLHELPFRPRQGVWHVFQQSFLEAVKVCFRVHVTIMRKQRRAQIGVRFSNATPEHLLVGVPCATSFMALPGFRCTLHLVCRNITLFPACQYVDHGLVGVNSGPHVFAPATKADASRSLQIMVLVLDRHTRSRSSRITVFTVETLTLMPPCTKSRATRRALKLYPRPF